MCEALLVEPASFPVAASSFLSTIKSQSIYFKTILGFLFENNSGRFVDKIICFICL